MRRCGLGVLVLASLAAVVAAGPTAAGADQPAPSPSAPASPPARTAAPAWIAFKDPVVFVLSLGKDVTTNAEVSVALAKTLKRNDDGITKRPTTFVPEGSWGLAEFLEQCKEDPDHTRGAFIVLPPSYESKTENFLIAIRSSATIQFNTMVATCNTAKAVPAVDWVSDTSTGVYGRSQIQFLPLAVLTSVYLAFAPQRLYQTATSQVYPTHTPIPKGGEQTGVVTTSSTTLNPAGTASLQNSVVGAVGFASLLFGRQASADHDTVHAAEDAAAKFVRDELKKNCPDWGLVGAEAAAKHTATEPEYCSW
jgi:hypothetical protein